MFTGLIDNYTQSVLVFAAIRIIAAYSFFAPFKTGQVSLGQAGFMAIGAYASAILTQKMGLPFAVALPFGGAVAGIIGIVVGFPALRIKGVYLLLLTLGFSEIVQVIILSWDYTGGAQGFRNIPFNPLTMEWSVGLIALLVIFFARLERSSLGRSMDSIEQDETAAEVTGIDVVRTKLLAFGIGAMIAGLAGALYAHHTTYVDSTTFNIMKNAFSPITSGDEAMPWYGQSLARPDSSFVCVCCHRNSPSDSLNAISTPRSPGWFLSRTISLLVPTKTLPPETTGLP